MTSEEIPATLAGERLDRLVALLTGRSRAAAAALVASGAVRIGGSPVTSGKHRVLEGDVVEVDAGEDGPVVVPDPHVDVVVVHEDADVVVVPVGRSAREPTRMAVSAQGREARTRYEVVDRWPGLEVALLRCRLETGRTHQIRVHLAAIGHPVVGDATYASGRRAGVVVPRMFLHAARLAFDHPVTGEPLAFDSPLPADLDQALPTSSV
jgi:23S rRNA-/tRNA-specific pseudouridylate synthase